MMLIENLQATEIGGREVVNDRPKQWEIRADREREEGLDERSFFEIRRAKNLKFMYNSEVLTRPIHEARSYRHTFNDTLCNA